MAEEYVLQYLAGEVLHEGDSDARVTGLGVEVLESIDLPTNVRVNMLGVDVLASIDLDTDVRLNAVYLEVLRPLNYFYSPAFIDVDFDTSPVHQPVIHNVAYIDDASGVPPVGAGMNPVDVPSEWNPFRPDVPEGLAESDPALYDYLREQAEILREQHNITQTGDSTYPWQMITSPGDFKTQNLGSLSRFVHPAYGVMQGRYVQFSNHWNAVANSIVGHDNSATEEWVVSNTQRRTDFTRVIGIAAPFEANLAGKFGWVIVDGRSPIPIVVESATPLTVGKTFTWSHTDEAIGTVGPGPAVGQVLDIKNISQLYQADMTPYPVPRYNVPVGAWTINRLGQSVTDEYISAQTAGQIADINDRMDATRAGLGLSNDAIAALQGGVNDLQGQASAVQANLDRVAMVGQTNDVNYNKRLQAIEKLGLQNYPTPKTFNKLANRVTILTTRLDELPRTDPTGYTNRFNSLDNKIGTAQSDILTLKSLVSGIVSGEGAGTGGGGGLTYNLTGFAEGKVFICTNLTDKVMSPVDYTLSALLDTDTTTTPATDGQALIWDEASGLWIPGDVASGGGGGGGGGTNSAHEAHRYWAILILLSDSLPDLAIGELEMRATAGGADQCTGGTAFASGNLSGYPASGAFDDSTGFWVAPSGAVTALLGYDFGTGVKVEELALTSRPDGYGGSTPNAFAVLYSDDGDNFSIAWQVANQSAWGTAEQRVFTNVAASDSGGGGSGTPWWFQPPAVADFPNAWGSAGTFTATDDSDVGLIMFQGTAGVTTRGISKPISVPAADWQATMRIDLASNKSGYSNHAMMCHNADFSKGLWWGWDNRQNIHFMKYKVTGYDGYEVAIPAANGIFWYRIKYVAATGMLSYYYSSTGKNWILCGTYAAKTYMGDPVFLGLGIATESSAYGTEFAVQYWDDTT